MDLDKLILEIEKSTRELNKVKEENKKIYKKNCRLEDKNKTLKLQLQELQEQLTSAIAETEHYKKLYFQNLNNESTTKIHNERGAGRKSKFSDIEVHKIKGLRAEGKTIKEIAEIYECGTATVNRILKK